MSWNCDRTRDCIREQGTLPVTASEHVATCGTCQEIIGMPSLDPPTLSELPSAMFDMDRLLEETQSRISNERGTVAWLRSRPNGVQVALGLVVSVVPAMVILAVARRADLAAYPAWRLVGFALALVGAAVLALRASLVPLFQRTPRLGDIWTAVVAFGVPFALATFAPAHATHSSNEALSFQLVVAQAVPCLRFGVITALPTVLLLLVIDRVQRVRYRVMVLMAAVGGACGNLVLLLHCGNEQRAHRLLGHALVGLAIVALCALIVRLARARPAAASTH